MGPFLHLDLDAFFASVEQRDNPHLRGKPIAVGGPGVGGANCFRGIVSTASYEARKFGVHSGLPIFKAIKLCPKLIIVPANFAKYQAVSNSFLTICSNFSPLVEPISIDELYLDLTGTQKLWGSPVRVAKLIREQVKKQLGITCSIGISWQKTCAKVASDINKPAGITFVPQGWETAFLASLPIKDLPGCGYATTSKLTRLGIKTVADLARHPFSHIKLLLGKSGTYLWQVASGQDPARVLPLEPAKSFSRSTTLSQNTADSEVVKHTLHFLTEKVASSLRAHQVSAKTVSVTIRNASFLTISRSHTLSLATNSTRILFNQAWEIAQHLLPHKEKIRLVGIGASHLEIITPSFLSDRAQSTYLQDRAVDQIRSKFGFLSIYPASLMKVPNPPQDGNSFHLQ